MNKNIVLIFLISILCSSVCFAQNVSLSILTENIIYQELPATIKIVVEGKKCGDFKVKVDNGTIDGNGCDYKITSKEIGRCNVTVYEESNKKIVVLETIGLRVKKVPPPYVVLANKQHGQIQYEEINNQKHIMCRLDNFAYDYRYLIKEFILTIERENQQIFQEKVIGYTFTTSILAEFTKLKKGDKIRISNISASGLNIETSDIKDIELTVEE